MTRGRVTGAEESTTSGLITNACGTFDPNEPGDSVILQDPDDLEIITACAALCDTLADVPDCTTDGCSAERDATSACGG